MQDRKFSPLLIMIINLVFASLACSSLAPEPTPTPEATDTPVPLPQLLQHRRTHRVRHLHCDLRKHPILPPPCAWMS